MKELSLFSGVGGGLLASKYFLGWKAIGYVEFETYPQKILKQRILDGLLDAAPIFGDIRSFISEGYADQYKGMVDVITAGFPCQPFSIAGKQQGENDSRNMWPETLEVIRRVRPRFAYLENVRGLLRSGYFSRVLGDLAESGYNARWRVLSAAEMGAPHQRERLWILAIDSSSFGWNYRSRTDKKDDRGNIPNKFGDFPESPKKRGFSEHRSCSKSSIDASDNFRKRAQRFAAKTIQGEQGVSWGKSLRGIEDLRRRSDLPEPLICGMDDGMAYYVDKIKAIGNGQVPHSMARAFIELTEAFNSGYKRRNDA